MICFGLDESWKLVKDMIDQVATVHKKHGMEFFHMGADEAFQVDLEKLWESCSGRCLQCDTG